MEITPAVYETNVVEAKLMQSRERDSEAFVIRTRNVEASRDRAARILSESGIELLSVVSIPTDLGYEQRKFIFHGSSLKMAEAEAELGKVELGVERLTKVPLLDAVYGGMALPFVIKRPHLDMRGVNKFRIDRADQVQTLMEYCEQPFSSGHDWYAEPYIETPGGVNSSYRIVVTSTGLVVASALLHKPRVPGDKAVAPFTNVQHPGDGIFKPYTIRKNKDRWMEFADDGSKWFLNADAITSNVSSGGRIIPLKIDGQLGTDRDLTEAEQKILADHGILDRETSPDLLQAAVEIGRVLGPRLALILGLDFLQDKDGNYYFIEANAYPGVDTVMLWWGIDPSSLPDKSWASERVLDDLYRIVGDSLRKLST